VKSDIGEPDKAGEGGDAEQRADRFLIVDRIAERDEGRRRRDQYDAFAKIGIRADLVPNDRLDECGVDCTGLFDGDLDRVIDDPAFAVAEKNADTRMIASAVNTKKGTIMSSMAVFLVLSARKGPPSGAIVTP